MRGRSTPAQRGSRDPADLDEIVTVDSGGYGEFRREMPAASMTPTGVGRYVPDLAAGARAFGAHGNRTDDPDALSRLVAAAFGADRPTIVVMEVPGA